MNKLLKTTGIFILGIGLLTGCSDKVAKKVDTNDNITTEVKTTEENPASLANLQKEVEHVAQTDNNINNNNIKDNNTRFYCPNPECSARLTLKANSSIAGISPYFSNLPSAPHIENCFCQKKNFSFDDREYEETLFNLEEIVNEYTTNNIINIDRRLETMSAIFYMCKTRNINDTYNQIKIWKILVATTNPSIDIVNNEREA